MNPGLKAFLLHMLVSAFCALVAFLCIAGIMATSLSNDVKLGIVLSLVVPAFIIGSPFITGNEGVKEWIAETSGYHPPPPKPKTPAQQKFAQVATLTLCAAFLIVAWVWVVPQQTTPFNAFFSAVAGILAMASVLLGNAFDEWLDHYGGATLGLFVSLFVLSFPADSDWPLFVVLLIFAIPTAAGHLIQRWWNKQDFIIARRRQKQLEQQQEKDRLAAEEVAKLQDAHLQAVKPVAIPGELTQAQKNIAADLDRLLKQ